MEFHNIIYALSEKVVKNKEHCSTEEATKTSLILPFITALGYDTTDPLEVLPEAPCAIKGFDRIDYILAHRGEYRILVECKHWKENLDNHVKQLEQYFMAALKPYRTRVGILTNGIEYRFFADTDRANLMDDEPFFVFDISKPTDEAIECLKMFRRDVFDADRIVERGRKIKFDDKLHRIVDKELSSPSDELVNFFWYKIYPSKRLPKQRENFTQQIKDEIANYTLSRINRAVETSNCIFEQPQQEATTELPAEVNEALSIIQDILKHKLEPSRISAESHYGYFSVRLDNNQWRPICKLHLSGNSRWISVGRYWPPSRKFYTSTQYKHELNAISEIRNYAQELVDIITIMLLDTHKERIDWVETHHKEWLE